MISIEKPLQVAGDVYRACVKRTQDASLRTALEAESNRVELRSAEYTASAAIPRLHTFFQEDPLHVTRAQLADVYDRVLVKGGERAVYDALKGRARFRRCPLCGQRDVQTLDHYLPRGEYPELCVTPANLVPCCRECNGAKHEHVPTSHDEQMFHPYFDDWSETVILQAEVVLSHTVEVVFSILASNGSPEWIERAKTHFTILNLGTLYAEHAAIELVQCKKRFRSVFAVDGAQGLRRELQDSAVSRTTPFPNAWQPALYRALASSAPFCDGGFELIEE